jgi:hypothetical protein
VDVVNLDLSVIQVSGILLHCEKRIEESVIHTTPISTTDCHIHLSKVTLVVTLDQQ